MEYLIDWASLEDLQRNGILELCWNYFQAIADSTIEVRVVRPMPNFLDQSAFLTQSIVRASLWGNKPVQSWDLL